MVNERKDEIDALINDLQQAVDVLEQVSPGSYTVRAVGRVFAAELNRERGPRKTFIKRLKAELVSVARETLSPAAWEAFLQAAPGIPAASGTTVITKILNRGKILSEKEFTAVMIELNETLQAKPMLSTNEEAVIKAVNQLLREFEGNNKQVKLKRN